MKSERNLEFDLASFQSEIINDFNNLRYNIGAARLYKVGNIKEFKKQLNRSNQRIDLLSNCLYFLVKIFGKRIYRTVVDTDDFREKEKKAMSIIRNPKIKQLLCKSLNRQFSPDLSPEECIVRIVKIVTSSLLDDQISEEFFIEKNVRLYSLIVYNIYKERVQIYCL